jgi:hypothetical protein
LASELFFFFLTFFLSHCCLAGALKCLTIVTIVKLWKQPRCPTTSKWIKKMLYSYTMEFYIATKQNGILSFASKWMELENIILSEVS